MGSTVTATNNDHDGHNHDDQLGEIYPTMLNELNCTFGISFSCFYCCGHHGHGLWPVVCGRHGIGPKQAQSAQISHWRGPISRLRLVALSWNKGCASLPIVLAVGHSGYVIGLCIEPAQCWDGWPFVSVFNQATQANSAWPSLRG